MSTVNQITVTIPAKHIQSVVALLRANKVKHEPFSKQSGEYAITLQDSPLVSFLQLRFN